MSDTNCNHIKEKSYHQIPPVHLRSRGSFVVARCCLKESLRSLLRPMSWNILCNFEVYSKPHACYKSISFNNQSSLAQQNGLLFYFFYSSQNILYLRTPIDTHMHPHTKTNTFAIVHGINRLSKDIIIQLERVGSNL